MRVYQNLLRWSLKLHRLGTLLQTKFDQNLLRWSLKLSYNVARRIKALYQNLLRWSLKQAVLADNAINDEALEFTPLEFETKCHNCQARRRGRLEFTPLEFETTDNSVLNINNEHILEFTPLEFETQVESCTILLILIRIYSVGV